MHSPLINVMSAAAIKAGKGLLRDFGEVDQLQISRKGTADFVTNSDTRTEKLLQRELDKARPGYSFLLEEGGEIVGRDPSHCWIIDPLDGTTNFIHAVPYFCISIALQKTDKNGRSEVIAGVIYDPIHNELFAGEKGKGATVNDRRLNVSARDNMETAMLVTGNLRASLAAHNGAHHVVDNVASSGASVRHFGATALDLANLAAGRFDACWYYNIKPWDIAAGMLFVQEAGGMITDVSGAPATVHSKAILASNRHFYTPVQKLLSKVA